MILLPHFDIPYGFGLGKIPYDLPFQGPVFFGLVNWFEVGFDSILPILPISLSKWCENKED